MNIYAQYRRISRHKRRLADMALQHGTQHPLTQAQSRLVDRLVLPVQRRELEAWKEAQA